MSNKFTFSDFNRPTKIEWLYPQLRLENWTEGIVSKSTRKIAERLDELIEAANLEFKIIPLNTEAFQEWLRYYEQKMTEQGHDVIANEEWLSNKTADGYQVFLIDVVQQNKRVGTAVFSVNTNQKFTEHFKASDRIDVSNLKNASVGTLIDLFYIRNAISQVASLVSSGVSRNGFGFYNNLGYIAFKIKLGYKPQIASTATLEKEFEYNTEEACIWFSTIDNKQLEILTINDKKISQEICDLLSQLQLPITNKGIL